MLLRLRRFAPTATFIAAVGVALACAVVSASQPRTHDGFFTSAQVAAGAREYAQHCARCHGANLEGSIGSPLKGDSFTTLGSESGLSIGSFFRFVTSETPVGAGGSLSHDQYVEILAFILRENGYPPGPRKLSFAAALRSRVRITPQRD
jgi:polar amino acid transport system substrate-binding protein